MVQINQFLILILILFHEGTVSLPSSDTCRTYAYAVYLRNLITEKCCFIAPVHSRCQLVNNGAYGLRVAEHGFPQVITFKVDAFRISVTSVFVLDFKM